VTRGVDFTSDSFSRLHHLPLLALIVMTEKVKVTALGAVKDVCVSDWPSGSFLCKTVDSFRIKDDSIPIEDGDDPARGLYWQACARWALLHKFGHTRFHPGYVVSSANNKSSSAESRHVLQIKDDDIGHITAEWNAVLEKKPPPSITAPEYELFEFLSTLTSNGKELQWAVMECRAGCQFRLHSHPNLELVYCVNGSLFEIRRSNANQSANSTSASTLSWSFGTLHAGQWLVNETDSVHKSFTATNGSGCILLVLWSGSHANLDEIKSVQEAVDSADEKQKISDCTAKDCAAAWGDIDETFLPESEKSKAGGPN
jgi:hypothetical protein